MSVIDFDAFRAEQKAEPMLLKIGGKTYKLPPSMPAALALDIVRLKALEGDDANVQVEDLLKVGSALFGGEAQFQSILAEGGITMDELPELLKKVITAYSPSPNRETRRAQARRGTTSTSSRTGRSSKLTS